MFWGAFLAVSLCKIAENRRSTLGRGFAPTRRSLAATSNKRNFSQWPWKSTASSSTQQFVMYFALNVQHFSEVSTWDRSRGTGLLDQGRKLAERRCHGTLISIIPLAFPTLVSLAYANNPRSSIFSGMRILRQRRHAKWFMEPLSRSRLYAKRYINSLPLSKVHRSN